MSERSLWRSWLFVAWAFLASALPAVASLPTPEPFPFPGVGLPAVALWAKERSAECVLFQTLDDLSIQALVWVSPAPPSRRLASSISGGEARAFTYDAYENPATISRTDGGVVATI